MFVSFWNTIVYILYMANSYYLLLRISGIQSHFRFSVDRLTFVLHSYFLRATKTFIKKTKKFPPLSFRIRYAIKYGHIMSGMSVYPSIPLHGIGVLVGPKTGNRQLPPPAGTPFPTSLFPFPAYVMLLLLCILFIRLHTCILTIIISTFYCMIKPFVSSPPPSNRNRAYTFSNLVVTYSPFQFHFQ